MSAFHLVRTKSGLSGLSAEAVRPFTTIHCRSAMPGRVPSVRFDH